MRLTLRTLLAYLDDMLDPGQAKIIGAKVAESEQAREQMERIKQVTRRRRLTTPPASGPGGIDPNTIAEYLDNEVTPETAAEVEQICLASDLHLAEVAACHQILTLVLGEPALVPPTAKHRMYALVKGPESLPPHKHAKASRKQKDQDLSSELDVDDDSVRLGIPFLGRGDARRFWLVVGSGVLAACLLVVAVWQIIRHTGQPEEKGDQHAKTEEKNKPTPVPPTPQPQNQGDQPTTDGANKKDKGKQTPAPTPVFPQPEVVPVKIEPIPVIDYKPANMTQQKIGKYLTPTAKEPGVLLQNRSDKPGWTTFVGKNPPVTSGRTLMSLPGSKSLLQLDSGIELTLWGNLPELTGDAILAESRVVLHAHQQLDVDLTLERGRILLRNPIKEKRTPVRVRFDNPLPAGEEYLELILYPESAVVVERFCELRKIGPIVVDGKEEMRKSAVATVRVYAYANSVRVRYAKKPAYTIEASQRSLLEWQNRKGTMEMSSPPILPAWLVGFPEPKTDLDKKIEADRLQARKRALEAANALARSIDNNPAIDVALEEVLDGVAKDLALPKRNDLDISFRWRHAVRTLIAVDDIGRVFDEFQADTTPMIMRYLFLHSMQQWLAWSRDHDAILLTALQKRFKKSEPERLLDLFHPIATEEIMAQPARFDDLIDGLRNEHAAFRALCYFQLLRLAPDGGKIPYDVSMPRPQREQAWREWRKIQPPTQMPPEKTPPKKAKTP